jgi:hypothetical protein
MFDQLKPSIQRRFILLFGRPYFHQHALMSLPAGLLIKSRFVSSNEFNAGLLGFYSELGDTCIMSTTVNPQLYYSIGRAA